MAFWESTIGITQGTHRGADLANLSSLQSGGSLAQGQKKIRSWSETKNSDMGAVAPLQYHRVPGDPDRSLHAKKGSWLRLLGSGLSDGTLDNPLGQQTSGMGVLGGDFSLVSGAGIEGQKGSILSRGFSNAVGRLPETTITQGTANNDEVGSYMQSQPESGTTEGFSNLDEGSHAAFDYGGKLGTLQDAYMGRVDETLNKTEPSYRNKYENANGALKERQEEYVNKSEYSRKYRNSFVNAGGKVGYVTNMGGFRELNGYDRESTYKRGCPASSERLETVELNKLHSHASDGNPLALGGSCPPSGSNVQIMGATDPAFNIGEWGQKCFDADNIETTFPIQGDLTGKAYADVVNNCRTRAADLGSAAYSVSKTHTGSAEGEWMCRVGKNGASWHDLTSNNTKSTIERTEVIENIRSITNPVLKVTSDGLIKVFEGATGASVPLRMVSSLEPYIDCDADYGAPISLISATLGGNCNGKGPETLNPALTLAKQTIDYAANISGLFTAGVEDESPQEEVVVEQISQFDPVLADPMALPVLDDAYANPSLCNGDELWSQTPGYCVDDTGAEPGRRANIAGYTDEQCRTLCAEDSECTGYTLHQTGVCSTSSGAVVKGQGDPQWTCNLKPKCDGVPTEGSQDEGLCNGSHPIEIDGIAGKKACCSKLRSSVNPTDIGQCVAGWGDPGVVCNPYLDESAMYPWNMMGGGEIPKCGVA